MEKIKEAQHGHPSIDGIKRKVSLGKASEFNVDEQGILWSERDFAYQISRTSNSRFWLKAAPLRIQSTLEEQKCTKTFRKIFGGTV